MHAILMAVVLLLSSRSGASGTGAQVDRGVARAVRPDRVGRSAGDRGCPETRCDRAARPGCHRGEEAAGRRRARGPRRSRFVSEGDRESRARAGGRADDARHGVRSGVAHQGRGDDDQRDDARRAGAHQAERPRVVLHPRLRTLRQGRHHRSVTCSRTSPGSGQTSTLRTRGWATRRRSRLPSTKCPRRGLASASSTATSTSSSSATSSSA